MPDLEPITRKETLLDGGDLTPITRKEMFIKRIYDKTQSVPEPITREEYFLAKAGEGSGGDVTIKQLNVTENGTYSESGKAYSPVVVNVPTPPVPENAYLLNNLSDLPADIASFNDGTDLPMASLKVSVTPYQDLSHGDPSPENICPIIGWDEAVVTVADDAESPTTSHEYTIDLDGTRYGGTLDVVSGELVVKKAYVDLGTLNWSRTTSYSVPIFYSTIAGKLISNISMLCSAYKFSGNFSSAAYFAQSSENGSIGNCYNNEQIFVRDDSYTDATTFKTAMNGVQLVYELATPITVQLTPTPVKSLVGTNNIFADCGDIIELEYFSKEV